MLALLLPVGLDRYAVPVSEVREVLVAPLVTPLPTAPARSRSLINVRGEIVPLLDTATLLGLGALEEVPYAVLVDGCPGVAAFALSGIPSFIDLEEPPDVSELPGTRGQYHVDGQVVVLLDAHALMQGTQEAPGGV